MEKQIFITVEGGLIQSIDVSEDVDVNITVVDLDTDGFDETVEISPGSSAILSSPVVNRIDDGDVDFWENVLRKEGE